MAPTGNGPAPLAGTVTAAPYAVVGPYSNVTVVALPRASIDAETLALVVAVAAPAPPVIRGALLIRRRTREEP